MPAILTSATPAKLKRFLPAGEVPLPSDPLTAPAARPLPLRDRRASLRDLYTAGLVSIFRRDSVLRIWEPLREAPRVAATTGRSS